MVVESVAIDVVDFQSFRNGTMEPEVDEAVGIDQLPAMAKLSIFWCGNRLGPTPAIREERLPTVLLRCPYLPLGINMVHACVLHDWKQIVVLHSGISSGVRVHL